MSFNVRSGERLAESAGGTHADTVTGPRTRLTPRLMHSTRFPTARGRPLLESRGGLLPGLLAAALFARAHLLLDLLLASLALGVGV